MVSVYTYPEPEFNRREILRYAGGGKSSYEVNQLMESCISELDGKLAYRVCSCRFPIKRENDALDLGFANVKSDGLTRNLKGCDEIVLFAATIGIEIDRLIARYSRVSPAKALMFQAIGAERIESLCDTFNDELSQKERASGRYTRPRFSPGYGDLPLELQRRIFDVLDCPRKIGLSLNDSFLMSPSKSVTAIIGIGDDCEERQGSKCGRCDNKSCSFRSE